MCCVFDKQETKRVLIYLIPTLIILVAGLLLATSCGSVKQIPVQTVEKVVYRDSLIYVQDTIKVEIPKETVKEVIPYIDTSFLKTSLAESVAYLDTVERKLHHTLTQKGEVKIKYDTIVKVQYVDRIIKQDVPVQVEVIKYKRDALFWCLLGWAVFCVILLGLKIFVFK